ncbi:hypothetical protein [Paenibacillus sp. XY044]|nr:hypothetical protein [Paenibacillus sp. XY044]
MSEDELQKFISTASPEQFIALRNKIEKVKNTTFEEFVLTLNNLIDLIV